VKFVGSAKKERNSGRLASPQAYPAIFKVFLKNILKIVVDKL